LIGSDPRGIETTGPIIQVAVVVFPIHQGHSSKRPYWSCQFLPEKAPVEATSYKARSMRWSDKVYGILQGCCANHRSELWRIRVCCSVLPCRLDRTSALHELTVRTSPKCVCLLHGHRGCRNQNLPEGTIIYLRIPRWHTSTSKEFIIHRTSLFAACVPVSCIASVPSHLAAYICIRHLPKSS
jgi:hypothetical protein